MLAYYKKVNCYCNCDCNFFYFYFIICNFYFKAIQTFLTGGVKEIFIIKQLFLNVAILIVFDTIIVVVVAAAATCLIGCDFVKHLSKYIHILICRLP